MYKGRQNFRLPLCSKINEPLRRMRFVDGEPSPIRCIKARFHPPCQPGQGERVPPPETTSQASFVVAGLSWERVSGATGTADAPAGPSIRRYRPPTYRPAQRHLIDDWNRDVRESPMHQFDPATSTGRSSTLLFTDVQGVAINVPNQNSCKRINRTVYDNVKVSPIGNDLGLTEAVYASVDRNLIYKVNASPYHGNDVTFYVETGSRQCRLAGRT